MTRLFRYAVVMMLALTLPSPAAASEQIAGPAPAGAAAPASSVADTDGASKLMRVMDSSGSMAEQAGSGSTKIEAARQSLNTVIDTLPTDQQLGLRVYGAQVRSKTDPGACTDSQLAVPVDTGNRGLLHDAVGAYKPYGETPIGYALQQAGQDLGTSGRRNIILVSDGESTCQPDPCVVARGLRADAIDVRIDVIGLNVAGSARNQLECVAQTGGGIYYDAHDSDELTDSLTRIAERAARPYEAIGQPVTGAKNLAHAPTIGDGDWVDKIKPSNGVYGSQLVYRIERTMTNSTLFASAALRAPDGASDVDLTLATPDGTECDSSFDSQLFTDGMLLSVGAAAGQLADEAQPVPDDDPCLTSRYLTAVVSYGDTDRAVPLELRVTEAPEISNLDDLAAPVDTPDWTSPDVGTTAITGGTSFGDAEHLEPGGYQGTIVPGETLTFSVDIDWGEQLNAAAHIDRLTGPLAQAVVGDPEAHLQVFGPARLPAGTVNASTDLDSEATLGDRGDDELGLTTGPVTYPNIGYNTGAAQSGTYTITLFLEDNNDNASLPVPYNLGIDLTGNAEGGPSYDEQPIDTDDTSPDNDTSNDTAAGEATGAPDDGRSSRLDWGIGLLLLGAIAAAVVRLRRQHRLAAASAGTASPVAKNTAPNTRSAGEHSAAVRAIATARRAMAGLRSRVRGTPPVDTVNDSTASNSSPQTGAPQISHPPAALTESPPTVAIEEIVAAAQGTGIGLTGRGAPDAARSILATLLTNPSGPVEVLIPEPDLAGLLGQQLTPAPARLLTAASLETALNWLEAELVTRTRDAETPTATGTPSLKPQIVLLARPAPGTQQRLAAVLGNGTPHGIVGIILGGWRTDATIALHTDGTIASAPANTDTTPAGGVIVGCTATEAIQRLASIATAQSPPPQPGSASPTTATGTGERLLAGRAEDVDLVVELYRLETLNPPRAIRGNSSELGTVVPTVDVLRSAVSREARSDSSDDTSINPAEMVADRSQASASTGDETSPPLVLSVFGPPALVWNHDGEHIDITAELSTRQLELVCYLALYPDGVPRDTLIETLWPDSPPDRPANSLQQATRRLRRTIAEATSDTVAGPVIIQGPRYQLERDVVAVDYWEFAGALTASRTANNDEERQAAYEQIVAAYSGNVADGWDFDWIDTPRHAARRDAIDAASRLAQHLVEDDPTRTLDLLETIRAFDPYNEPIYRDIMRLQHRLNYDDAIPRTLALLTTHLEDIDTRPSDQTTALAEQLQDDSPA